MEHEGRRRRVFGCFGPEQFGRAEAAPPRPVDRPEPVEPGGATGRQTVAFRPEAQTYEGWDDVTCLCSRTCVQAASVARSTTPHRHRARDGPAPVAEGERLDDGAERGWGGGGH